MARDKNHNLIGINHLLKGENILKPSTGLVYGLILLPTIGCAESQVPDYERHEGIIDFRPYVSANVSYDSNIFRLENSARAQQLLGTSQLSDSLLKTELGLETRLRLSRQLISVDLSVNDTKYDKFKRLDFTGNSKVIRWNWVLGSFLEGVISYNDSEVDSGFADVLSSTAVVSSNNLRTTQSTQASLFWHVHPDWTVFGSLLKSDFSNSNTAFIFSNRQENTYETGVRYISGEQNQVSLSFRNIDYDYPNRSATSLALFGNTSTRQDVIGVFTYNPTIKLNLIAKISAVSLDYPNHGNRNFDDISQRWTLAYTYSPDTSIGASIYREVNQVDDVVSTYAQNKGVGVTSGWIISPKISLGASAEFKTQEYLGSSGVSSTSIPRKDDIETYNLFAKYQATQKMFLQLNYLRSNRKSNTPNLSYDDNVLSASASYEF